MRSEGSICCREFVCLLIYLYSCSYSERICRSCQRRRLKSSETLHVNTRMRCYWVGGQEKKKKITRLRHDFQRNHWRDGISLLPCPRAELPTSTSWEFVSFFNPTDGVTSAESDSQSRSGGASLGTSMSRGRETFHAVISSIFFVFFFT